MAKHEAITINAGNLIDRLTHLPKHQDLHVWVDGANRLAIGPNPVSTSVHSRFGVGENSEVNPHTDDAAVENRVRMPRRSGSYSFEIFGRQITCRSLKELLAEALIQLEDLRTGTLDKLSHEMPRTKRIVARNASDLFPGKPNLSRRYSERLIDGWYYGTNNSAAEVEAWLKRAVLCADLTWAVDFKLHLND